MCRDLRMTCLALFSLAAAGGSTAAAHSLSSGSAGDGGAHGRESRVWRGGQVGGWGWGVGAGGGGGAWGRVVIHTYIHAHAHAHARANARTDTQTHRHIHTHSHTHARTHARTHKLTHTRTHTRTHSHTRTHTHTHAHTLTLTRTHIIHAFTCWSYSAHSPFSPLSFANRCFAHPAPPTPGCWRRRSRTKRCESRWQTSAAPRAVAPAAVSSSVLP